MAVDTEEKRRSVPYIITGLPPLANVPPTPDGAIDDTDLAHAAGFYREVEAEEPAPPPILPPPPPQAPGEQGMDTEIERRSVPRIVTGLPFLSNVPPVPDGEIDDTDRMQISGMYGGIDPDYVPPNYVNTADKRRSVHRMIPGLAGLSNVPPTPDGDLDSEADRMHVAGYYRGITLSAAAATRPRRGFLLGVY
jgi:hypothetical protein